MHNLPTAVYNQLHAQYKADQTSFDEHKRSNPTMYEDVTYLTWNEYLEDMKKAETRMVNLCRTEAPWILLKKRSADVLENGWNVNVVSDVTYQLVQRIENELDRDTIQFMLAQLWNLGYDMQLA